MRTTITILVSTTVLLLVGLLMGATGEGVGEKEVTKDAALLVSSSLRVSELTVYGVRLGDSVEKIPVIAGANRQSSERSQDEVYAGRNVCYFATGGIIYQIRVMGEITRAMPPYDATRLQMTLGKADDASQSDGGVIALGYFARHVQYTCRGPKSVAMVDIYAP